LLQTGINSADVEGSATLFADDAVVIQPRMGGLPEIYVGQDQIRWWLRSLVDQHAQIDASGAPWLRLDMGVVHVYWWADYRADAFRQLGLTSLAVESDAVLDDTGHIQSLRIELTPEAARSLQSAPTLEP